jgi:hypothetical protein
MCFLTRRSKEIKFASARKRVIFAIRSLKQLGRVLTCNAYLMLLIVNQSPQLIQLVVAVDFDAQMEVLSRNNGVIVSHSGSTGGSGQPCPGDLARH